MKNTLKRKIAALMAGVMVASSLIGLITVPAAAAETKTVGDFVFEQTQYEFSGQTRDGWKLIQYTGNNTNVVVPDTVDESHLYFDVEKINANDTDERNAFRSAVTDGNMVVEIAMGAIPSDKNIQTIQFPSYTARIEENDIFDDLHTLRAIKKNAINGVSDKFDSDGTALYYDDDEDGKKMFLFPKGYDGDYAVASDTESYAPQVFNDVNLRKLTLYGNVKYEILNPNDPPEDQKSNDLFENSHISEIVMQTSEYNEKSFLGAKIDRFSGNDSVSGSLVKNGELIYYGYSSNITDWSSITSVSSLAFQSEDLLKQKENTLPEGIKNSTVFRFFNGLDYSLTQRYFNVNGKTAFCYDYGKDNPETVGDIVDYDTTIETDSDKYNKVKALLYGGVPNNGDNLFEEIFEKPYNQNGYDINADAAKNVVGLLLWEIITDGNGGEDEYEFDSADVYGIDNNGFTTENIEAYADALRSQYIDNADDPKFYNFKLQFYQAVGDVQRLVVISDYARATEVEISKQDLTTGNELPGAHLVLKKDGSLVEEWDSEETPHTISLIDGSYELTETIAPKGYVLSTETVKFTIHNGVVSPSPVVMKNEMMQIAISKKDATTSKELPGAHLTLSGPDGYTYSWESGSSPEIIEGLADGTYTLREETAPSGYMVAEEVTFEVKNGKVDKPVEMLDRPNKVSITKKDITSGKELPGAKLTLTKDGATVDSWTSTNQPHVIEKLADGTYTLTEESAPSGYKVAESITFTVENGVVSKPEIEMFDEVEDWAFSISKKDLGTKRELAGASLRLTKDGSEVETWESSTTPKVFVNLKDGMYTLEEINPPTGYEKAQSITFEVKDRKVLVNNKEAVQVEMFDKKIEKPIEKSVEISKKDATTGNELPGARLELRDAEGTLVEEWVSESTPHVIKDLEDGTYTLKETTAPSGYEVAEEVTFTIKDGKATTAVVMYDKQIKEIEISKRDAVSKEELLGAKLEILDKDGKTVEEWVSGPNPHIVKNLPDGEYTLRETTAPDGYEKAEEVKFTVKDGKTEGEVVMYDQPTPKTITISKVDATTGKELPGATLTLKKGDKEIEKWTSTDTPHVISGIEDGEYTLIEETAPNGYKVAESITFKVENGVVVNGPIVMEDARKRDVPDKPIVDKNEPTEPQKETQPTKTPVHVVTETKPEPQPTTQAPTQPQPQTPKKDITDRQPVRTGDAMNTLEIMLGVMGIIGLAGFAVEKSKKK